MTSKKSPTIKQLLTEPTEANQAPTSLMRTIWNTSCGGYPASEFISVASSSKSGAEGTKKPARVRSKVS